MASVHPLHATMTSMSPAAARAAKGRKVRAMTVASLWAGMMTVPDGKTLAGVGILSSTEA